MPNEEFDTAVKQTLYQVTADTGAIPDAGGIAAEIGATEGDVLSAFARLHTKRLIVPEPGDPTRIRMAPPFSGVPTSFPVDAQGRRYFANCVWDAYGIAAALHADAVIPAEDAFSGESLILEVRNREPILHPYVAHFAVPAAKWWDDIVFT
ncbi:MAG: organomercurial lyase [Chthoniobacterales bacterium]